MRSIDAIAAVLVIVDALNWGLVGLCRFDLVSALLGSGSILSAIVCSPVGLAGIFQAVQFKAIQRRWRQPHLARA